MQAFLKTAKKYNQQKIDFILFHFKRSFESFVAGDFDDSFENAFKTLFDEFRGQYEFEDIHRIESYRKQRKRFADIRNSLAHAIAHSAKIKNIQDLRQIRKNLYENSLGLLTIVKHEYLDKICSYSLSPCCPAPNSNQNHVDAEDD